MKVSQTTWLCIGKTTFTLATAHQADEPMLADNWLTDYNTINTDTWVD